MDTLDLMVTEVIDGIKILNTTQLVDMMDELLKEEPFTPAYADKFKAWCKDNSVQYYARPKDEFVLANGVAHAAFTGRQYLLAEDLS